MAPNEYRRAPPATGGGKIYVKIMPADFEYNVAIERSIGPRVVWLKIKKKKKRGRQRDKKRKSKQQQQQKNNKEDAIAPLRGARDSDDRTSYISGPMAAIGVPL